MIKCKKGFVTIGTVMVFLVTLPFASSVVIKQRTDDLIFSDATELPERHVALVLGAAAYPSRLSDILQDRVDTAIELYETNKITKIIMTGAENEVRGMMKYAIENGVEENDIIEDPKGLNTYASIKNNSHIDEMTIITQGYHLPRALYIASHFGVDAVGYPSDKRTYAKMFEFKKRELLASAKAMMDLYL